MGRRKKIKTDFQETGSYFRLYREMVDSSAWQDISDKAKLGYQNIKYFYYGGNNKKIICPYSKLINKMAPGTWARVTKELYEHGFISLEYQSRGLANKPNVYGLSNDWKWWKTEKFPKREIKHFKDPQKGFKKLWKEDRKKMLNIRKKRKEKNKK